MQRLNPIKFWPPVILLVATLLFSLYDRDAFLAATKTANSWILDNFSWLFSWSVLLIVFLILVIYFSPFGKIIIGGKDARPLLTKWKWFSITLCTTIATGILFWGTAEPLFHFHEPPQSLGIEPGSMQAKAFAMSTMFMHWTISPYAIYTLAGLMFSYCFYNLNRPFEVGSTLFPLIGASSNRTIGDIADIICLYGLVAGMAASLGTGILTISAGLNITLGILSSNFVLLTIALAVVATFIISASSGLMKGIRLLSDYNMRAFALLAVFFFAFGPTMDIMHIGTTGLAQYVPNFIPRSINWTEGLDSSWFQSWTIFNWAVWLAWTPITALFLGRLGRGYSVRAFIQMNLIFPSIFGALWMMTFSGTALQFDELSDASLYSTMTQSGPESVIYSIIDELPLSQVVGPAFLLVTFISYVTAADSNTSAMSNICTRGITTVNQESPTFIKITWGIIIGVLAWVVISYAGIDGIKMISVLGGFPALFLVILIALGAIKIVITHKS
ncbi:MAG: BCCT family transporter [Cyclobacteriaceae bacterium]